jgi:hypothetical protein
MYVSCQHCGWDEAAHQVKNKFDLGPTIHMEKGGRKYRLTNCPGFKLESSKPVHKEKTAAT